MSNSKIEIFQFHKLIYFIYLNNLIQFFYITDFRLQKLSYNMMPKQNKTNYLAKLTNKRIFSIS